MTGWGVRDLLVRRGGGVVLDGVDLCLEPGAITAVVGADGAGKTTLLQVLAGTIAVEAGQVRRPPAQRLGGQLGTTGVWDDLTVEENLSFAAACYRLPGRAIAARAAELTAAAGLAAARRRPAAALSGGMRQRLGVCAALMHRPELVLLDEPTTGVDPVSRAQVWRLVAGAAAEGAAVALSTTHLDEAERASRVLVLDEGGALAAGTPADLIAAQPAAAGLEEVVMAAQLAREKVPA